MSFPGRRWPQWGQPDGAGGAGEASGAHGRARGQGAGHRDTLAARGNLAHAYLSAGRPAEAVALYEEMADGAERQLGSSHPVTLAARDRLAAAFLANGQPKDAIEQYRRLAADTEAAAGRDHPEAIAATGPEVTEVTSGVRSVGDPRAIRPKPPTAGWVHD